jgi:hypothetical protein
MFKIGARMLSIRNGFEGPFSFKKCYIFSPLCLEEAVELYKFDGFSSTVKEWNALRKAAVEMAFKEMLFPQLRY